MEWKVVGHTDQKAHIGRLIAEDALAHAYLLTGPGGIGKRMFADEVTIELHHGRVTAQNPDHLMLEPGVSEETGKRTDIPLDAAQDLKVWAYQRPLYGTVKTVLVDDADRLGAEAANALLKVLEEPPAYLRFFLVTSHAGSILPTIASRCQELAFRPLSDADMDIVLAGLRVDADDRELLRAVAAGRPGTARALVQAERLPDVARAVAQLETLLNTGTAERLIAAKTAAENNPAETVSWWLSWVHTRLPVRPQLAPVAVGLLDLAAALEEPKYNRRLALERFLLELPS